MWLTHMLVFHLLRIILQKWLKFCWSIIVHLDICAHQLLYIWIYVLINYCTFGYFKWLLLINDWPFGQFSTICVICVIYICQFDYFSSYLFSPALHKVCVQNATGNTYNHVAYTANCFWLMWSYLNINSLA